MAEWKVVGRYMPMKTRGFSDIVNITEGVNQIVRESGIVHGLAHIFVTGSTASISTIEYEPALVADFRDLLNRMIPDGMRTRHGDTWGDDNGFSHLRATLMGPGMTVPVHDSEIVLGTWQQICLIDHDNRPRDRQLFIQVLGTD